MFNNAKKKSGYVSPNDKKKAKDDGTKEVLVGFKREFHFDGTPAPSSPSTYRVVGEVRGVPYRRPVVKKVDKVTGKEIAREAHPRHSWPLNMVNMVRMLKQADENEYPDDIYGVVYKDEKNQYKDVIIHVTRGRRGRVVVTFQLGKEDATVYSLASLDDKMFFLAMNATVGEERLINELNFVF
jgi:hypothetical protein